MKTEIAQKLKIAKIVLKFALIKLILVEHVHFKFKKTEKRPNN